MTAADGARFAPAWESGTLKDHERQIDVVRLRAYRLARLQAGLVRHDYAAALLLDPINIRYANWQPQHVAVDRTHAGAILLRVGRRQGDPVGLAQLRHLSADLETIGETRPARGFYFFGAGNRVDEKAKTWTDVIAQHCGRSRRITIDRLDPPGTHALERHGLQIFDGQAPSEIARSIKSEDQVHHDIDSRMRPGMNLHEASELAWPIPGVVVKSRYSRGGMCDEWPRIAYRQDRPRATYDGERAPGMTMCVESYIGPDGGREGVKLEQQVRITERGCRLLSTFPFEDTLMTFVDRRECRRAQW